MHAFYDSKNLGKNRTQGQSPTKNIGRGGGGWERPDLEKELCLTYCDNDNHSNTCSDNSLFLAQVYTISC